MSRAGDSILEIIRGDVTGLGGKGPATLPALALSRSGSKGISHPYINTGPPRLQKIRIHADRDSRKSSEKYPLYQMLDDLAAEGVAIAPPSIWLR